MTFVNLIAAIPLSVVERERVVLRRVVTSKFHVARISWNGQSFGGWVRAFDVARAALGRL